MVIYYIFYLMALVAIISIVAICYVIQSTSLFLGVKNMQGKNKILVWIPLIRVFTLFKLIDRNIIPLLVVAGACLIPSIRYLCISILIIYIITGYAKFYLKYNVNAFLGTISLLSLSFELVYITQNETIIGLVSLVDFVIVIMFLILKWKNKNKYKNDNFNNFNNNLY